MLLSINPSPGLTRSEPSKHASRFDEIEPHSLYLQSAKLISPDRKNINAKSDIKISDRYFFMIFILNINSCDKSHYCPSSCNDKNSYC